MGPQAIRTVSTTSCRLCCLGKEKLELRVNLGRGISVWVPRRGRETPVPRSGVMGVEVTMATGM
jgi:hypothetical protein